MTRALASLAAIAALAVSAAPAASAGSSKAPKQGAIIYNGHAGLGANHTKGTVRIINAAGGWDPLHGTQVIETLSVDYT